MRIQCWYKGVYWKPVSDATALFDKYLFTKRYGFLIRSFAR